MTGRGGKRAWVPIYPPPPSSTPEPTLTPTLSLSLSLALTTPNQVPTTTLFAAAL